MSDASINCEQCGIVLPAKRYDDPHLTAAKAKNAGVWVKNFLIHGDKSGYHFFCCQDHGTEWRHKNIGKKGGSHE